MMRMRILTGVVILLAIGAVAATAQEGMTGTVLSASGTVQVKRAGSDKLEKAVTGMELKSGDTIWTRANSKVALSLKTEQGPRISKLGADAELIIGQPDSGASSEGKLNILSGLSSLMSNKPVEEELAISGVIRPIDTSTIKLLAMPMNSFILDPTPTIEWAPLEGALSYQITIQVGTSETGQFVLLDKSISETSISLEDTPMERGKTYTVVVAAKTLEGKLFVSMGALHPVSDERAARIRMQLQNPELDELDETAQTYILGQYLRNEYFYANAYELYSRYLEEHPNEEFAEKALEQIEMECKLREPTH